MHDSFLMQNISKEIKEICSKNNLKAVSMIEISVAPSSHLTEENLLDHLKDLNGDFVDENTKIKVNYEAIDDLTAVIKRVEGEKI
ncbi:hypothetical protein KQI89_15015 [Clostridium sp. MSJ-4]|uniref:Hydrogenase maturation nickel metallochaperone HypA n=1 Tax=Clostridium simiarum TaxID=2841506 RepID=A0ABS6F5H0_9CLOT|nr:hypothetical protein [Clostridium simiarum]MBU5593060.1 hypothetical protein [Clostridium simiarum]